MAKNKNKIASSSKKKSGSGPGPGANAGRGSGRGSGRSRGSNSNTTNAASTPTFATATNNWQPSSGPGGQTPGRTNRSRPSERSVTVLTGDDALEAAGYKRTDVRNRSSGGINADQRAYGMTAQKQQGSAVNRASNRGGRQKPPRNR